MSYAKIAGSNLYTVAKRNGVAMRTIAKYGALSNINSGLIGWWKFDEASGASAADSSGNGITGTLVNAPSWVAGKINNALDFNGSTQYVTMGDVAALEGLTDLTISAWISLDAWPAGGNVSFMSGKEDVYKVDITDAGKVRFLTGDNWTGSILTSASALSVATWYHIVAVKNGTTKTIYINAVSDATAGTTGGSVGSNTNAVQVGARNAAPADTFNGQIDDVRIYNRALSADDIAALYNVTAP